MRLLTKELRKQLPPLHSSENVADPMVVCKFTLWDLAWDWYIIEFDGKDTFFGHIAGFEPELGYSSVSKQDPEMGYFSLSELESTEATFYPPVERDLDFRPQPLSQVRKLHE